MLRRMTRSALLCTLLALPLGAQDIDAIFSRYNAAVDPDNRSATINGMKVTGSFEMAAAGIRAEMTIIQRRPKQILSIVRIEGIGEMRQGSDGTTTWSSDPMGGPRLLTGPEAATLTDGADFDTMRRARANYTAVEPAGTGEVNGEKCERVKLTWKSGRVTTECFSVATGLLVESTGAQATPQGEVQTTTHVSDYRDIGGVKMAHRIVTSFMGVQQVMTVATVQLGDQDPAQFDLPPAIKALKSP